MLGVIFLVPETAYRRNSVIPLLVSDEGEVGVHMKLGQENEQHLEKVIAEKKSTSGPVEEKHTYIRSLRIFTGRYSDAPIWKIMLRPVVMWFYPAVLWAFLIYGRLSFTFHLPIAHYAFARC